MMNSDPAQEISDRYILADNSHSSSPPFTIHIHPQWIDNPPHLIAQRGVVTDELGQEPPQKFRKWSQSSAFSAWPRPFRDIRGRSVFLHQKAE